MRAIFMRFFGVTTLVGLLVLGVHFGGSAGCGGGSGVRGATAGTSTDAGLAATSAVLSALSSASGAATSGGAATSLTVQALQLSLDQISEGLGAVTTAIPSDTISASFSCVTGSTDISATFSGSFTQDDTTLEVTSITLNLSESTTFNSCAPSDISTTSTDESTYTFDGTLTGTGTIAVDQNTFSFTTSNIGTVTISNTCNGSLTFNLTASGSGSVSNISGFSCSASGTVTGTACGVSLTCEVGGDCDNPSLDC